MRLRIVIMIAGVALASCGKSAQELALEANNRQATADARDMLLSCERYKKSFKKDAIKYVTCTKEAYASFPTPPDQYTQTMLTHDHASAEKVSSGKMTLAEYEAEHQLFSLQMDTMRENAKQQAAAVEAAQKAAKAAKCTTIQNENASASREGLNSRYASVALLSAAAAVADGVREADACH